MIPDDEAEALSRGAVGIATAQIAERRFSELGLLASKCAEAGVSFCYTAEFKDSGKPESKARALGFIFCGDLPDDLVEMITSYVRGAVQDFTNGNKDLTVLYKSRPDENDQT